MAPEGSSLSWRKQQAGQGSRRGNLPSHNAVITHRQQRENRRQAEALDLRRLREVNCSSELPVGPTPSTVSPAGPHIQLCEPKEDLSYLNNHIPLHWSSTDL